VTVIFLVFAIGLLSIFVSRDFREGYCYQLITRKLVKLKAQGYV